MELRPYQREAVDAAFRYCATYDGHPLLVLPTGAGKSLVLGTIAAEALGNDPGARALILAHRKELIQQNVKAVATAMPLGRIGVYSAGLKRRDVAVSVLVAGIQSVAKRAYQLGAWDVILIDEAHLVPTEDSTMYRKFLEAARIMNPRVRLIGLTATPYRLSTGLLHRGPSALFTDIAYEANVRDLIGAGYLCKLISRATVEKLDVRGVATRGGEYVAGDLERAVDLEDTTARVVAEMARLFERRNKWLVFCAGVKHAQHVAEALSGAGVPAAAVHGELDAETRASLLADFKAGRLRALTSMDVLTTGYDEPAIDAIALLRPTKSTGLYVQMVGRGFRLHPSKQDTLVLDFAGCVAQHGPVDCIEVRDASSGKNKDGEAPAKECDACHALVHLSMRACPECGQPFPEPPKPPIIPEASLLPILSTEPAATTWHDVSRVLYFRHEKEGKSPSLRVEYYGETGWQRIASEWICLEHTGFARSKAERWWALRADTHAPASVDEALAVVEELLTPVAIATQPEGKFTRVVDARFAGEPKRPTEPTLPKACWSCGFFSAFKMCEKWKAEPPAEVQKEGCDAWVEEVDTLVPF